MKKSVSCFIAGGDLVDILHTINTLKDSVLVEKIYVLKSGLNDFEQIADDIEIGRASCRERV